MRTLVAVMAVVAVVAAATLRARPCLPKARSQTPSLRARAAWARGAEVEAAAALCTPARAAPERVQGVRGEPHRSWNQEARTRLAFHVKAGDAGAVLWCG